MEARLPCGYFDDAGRRHRDAELVGLRGHDEELLAGTSATPAELVTDLLTRCVQRIGPVAPVDANVARGLAVGDRQFLLLKLREATFGPQVVAVTACPWAGCGQKVDVDFRIPDVPVREYAADAPFQDVELSAEAAGDGGSEGRQVRYRLPSGADQEDLAAAVAGDPAGALTALLERCVVGLGGQEPPAGEVAALSPRARAEIEQAMGASAPGPELTMEASCPSCARRFWIPFDVQDFFFGELSISTDLLYRQVHYLAYHYHWSEGEILGLPRDKRLGYIEVLAEEIERLNDAMG